MEKIPWRRNRLPTLIFLAFPGGSVGKNLPAMQETWVSSLGWENPLEKGTATHSSILAWRIPSTEELGRLQFKGSQRVRLSDVHFQRQKVRNWYPEGKKAVNTGWGQGAGLSRSVISDPLRPRGLYPASLLCPWRFFRQEYWSGLPCPPPGDLPNPGIKPRSPVLQVDS